MLSAFSKVLIISSEFPPNVGGIGNHAYNLARALAAANFDVSVIADIIDVDKANLQSFASKESFKIYWISREKFVVQSYLKRISTAVAEARKADKIICSGKFPLWVSNFIKLTSPGKELTAVVHGTELDLKSTFARRLTAHSLCNFSKVISVSNYTEKFLPKSLPSKTRKFIIHNGINTSEFDITEVSPLPGSPALITVGNVTERKGQENVVNALPEITHDFPAVQYHIVGKPGNKQKVQTKAKQLNVDGLIRFYGAVKRTELLQKLKGAAIKVMLSNHTKDGDFEGFGIAVLEANAFGVPAVGSKNSGIADAIVHGQTGLLVDQCNCGEVAAAIKTIMTNYSCFSAQAKKWAMQHDWNIIVKEYVAVLTA